MQHTPGTRLDVQEPADDLKTERLAELVNAITGCGGSPALYAVLRVSPRPPDTADEALEVVARAIVSVSKGLDLRDEPAED